MRAEMIFGKGGLIEEVAFKGYDPEKWKLIKEDIEKELEKYCDKDVISKDLAVSLFNLYGLATRDNWSIRVMSDISNYVYDVFGSLENPDWENMPSGFEKKED